MEWLISTPAFHHWHHTRTGPLNRNYASTLPWIDRLFGTHYLPRDQWPSSYGIRTKLPDSLAGQLAYPLVAPPARPAPPVPRDVPAPEDPGGGPVPVAPVRAGTSPPGLELDEVSAPSGREERGAARVG